MSSDFNEVHYPNLTNCKVELLSSTATTKPIVTLPADFHSGLRTELKEPYDFSLERSILKRKEDLDQELALATADSKEELQKNFVVKMKSVTGENDDVCISMLESNSYDLKTSIETYFLKK